MKRWAPRTRRVLLIFVSILCVCAGATVLFTQVSAAQLSRASALELAALLGLFVLPWMTLASTRLERRLRRRAVSGLKT